MQRVLDIDLDFFVKFAIHSPQSEPDPATNPIWDTETEVMSFLADNCLLGESRRPGFVTKTHDELFFELERGISAGTLIPPFHVTHLDGHADLGLGGSGHLYVMKELLHVPLSERPQAVAQNRQHLNEGNWLLFAIACGWVHDLTYVYGQGGGSDTPSFAMKDFHWSADNIQLAAIKVGAYSSWSGNLSSGAGSQRTQRFIHHLEPEVPITQSLHLPESDIEYDSINAFRANAPFDFVCLARSPLYAPSTAEPYFEAIRAKFIQ